MWNCLTYMKFMFNIVIGFPPIYLSLMFVCLFFSLYLCLFVQSLSDQKEYKEREKKNAHKFKQVMTTAQKEEQEKIALIADNTDWHWPAAVASVLEVLCEIFSCLLNDNCCRYKTEERHEKKIHHSDMRQILQRIISKMLAVIYKHSWWWWWWWWWTRRKWWRRHNLRDSFLKN